MGRSARGLKNKEQMIVSLDNRKYNRKTKKNQEGCSRGPFYGIIGSMDVKIAENKEEWDSWLHAQGSVEFLQSWEWGEFQKSTGKEVLRLQCVEEGVVKGQIQGFLHVLKKEMRYFYAPRVHVTKKMLDCVVEFLKNKNIVFLRFEPDADISCLLRLYKTKPRQPQHTLILDITKSSRELLEQMHPKTRYNIRLAQKKGVELVEEKNVDVFFALNEETTKRDGFKSHEKEYYAQMLQYPFVHQVNAYYEGVAIASVLLIVFGKRCTYLHGASGSEYRNVMAPYFLQWGSIQFAQALHCTQYDFWGIAPIIHKETEANALSFHGFQWEGNHRFAGVTRFKVGFGGEVKNYPDGVEVAIQKWKYKLYRVIKTLKR